MYIKIKQWSALASSFVNDEVIECVMLDKSYTLEYFITQYHPVTLCIISLIESVFFDVSRNITKLHPVNSK